MPVLDVLLHNQLVGHLEQRGEFSRFWFTEEYLDADARPVLGLDFEQNLAREYTGQRTLPSWFANLLPEGSLRQIVNAQFRTRVGREPSQFETLLELGRDLPGDVIVTRSESDGLASRPHTAIVPALGSPLGGLLDYSVAGVTLKFSAIREDDKFVVPMSGQDGDWLVKLPDPTFRLLPVNEYASMRLARRVGLDTAEVALIERDDLPNVPSAFWRGEGRAVAVRRFDRVLGRRVHIEDFAQVRGFFVGDRYSGNFETLGSLIWRRSKDADFREFIRRLVFSLMIGNDDAHLKNWSLIYRDGRDPRLSPAYDLVSVEAYTLAGLERGTGLKINGSRRYEAVSREGVRRIARKVGYEVDDIDYVLDATIKSVNDEWDEYLSELEDDVFVSRVSNHKMAMVAQLQSVRATGQV